MGLRKLLARAVVALAAVVIAAPAMAQGALKLPPYKRVKLKNGMTLLLMEQHEVPIISFHTVVRTGAVADPAGKEGLASLTAGLLRKGTKTRTAVELSTELDFIGGTLFAGAGADSTSVSAEFVKKDLAKGLDLLSDMLMSATFPQEEFAKLVMQHIDGVKSARDFPQGVIGQYFNAYLFGTHPYARPANGDEESLAAVTRGDVMKFYEANYVPGGVILAVAGDFHLAEMEKLLTDRFGAWPAKAFVPPRLPDAAPVSGRRLLLVDKPDATQTFFRIGNVGIARSNPDRVAIDVVNTLFGGRFTSWLSTELRIKSGLTYGAGSTFDERLLRGAFFMSSFTPNKTTEQCIDLALLQLKKLHEQGITQEELQSAKTYIKGQFPPQVESTDQLARTMASLDFFGLDEREIDTLYAKIDAMTLADARRIIQQYFPRENLTFVLVGKASEIEPLVRKYAPTVDRKSITSTRF